MNTDRIIALATLAGVLYCAYVVTRIGTGLEGVQEKADAFVDKVKAWDPF